MAEAAPYLLQYVWPIVDETYTRSELIAEASPELEHFADQHDATIAGPVAWLIEPAADVPDWVSYAPGTVLIARAPAQRHTLPSPWRSRRDIDPVKVERALAGDTVAAHQLGTAERAEAVRIAATTRGLSDAQIAERLGIATRSVVRIRGTERIPAAVPRHQRKEAA